MKYAELPDALSASRLAKARVSSKTPGTWLLLIPTLLLGAYLRLVNLDRQSLWGDEVCLAVVGSRPFQQAALQP